jgi:uncharacterized protein (TIGR03067 family)
LSNSTVSALAATVTFSGDRANWKANPTPDAGDLDKMLNAFGNGGIFQLDAMKSPKTIEMRMLRKEKENPAAKAMGHELIGIYRLEGDTLELCVAIDPDLPDEIRPTKFESVSGKFIVYLVLKRMSDEPANESGWVQLFNGKDLSGWNPSDDSGNWKVKGGELTGMGINAYIVIKKKDYRHFHLRAERTVDDAKAFGIIFRGAPGDNVAFEALANGELLRAGKPGKASPTLGWLISMEK